MRACLVAFPFAISQKLRPEEADNRWFSVDPNMAFMWECSVTVLGSLCSHRLHFLIHFHPSSLMSVITFQRRNSEWVLASEWSLVNNNHCTRDCESAHCCFWSKKGTPLMLFRVFFLTVLCWPLRIGHNSKQFWFYPLPMLPICSITYWVTAIHLRSVFITLKRVCAICLLVHSLESRDMNSDACAHCNLNGNEIVAPLGRVLKSKKRKGLRKWVKHIC